MIKMRLTEDATLKTAIEIAKIVCANPRCELYLDKSSAQDVSEFILGLADKLSSQSPESSNELIHSQD